MGLGVEVISADYKKDNFSKHAIFANCIKERY